MEVGKLYWYGNIVVKCTKFNGHVFELIPILIPQEDLDRCPFNGQVKYGFSAEWYINGKFVEAKLPEFE